MNVTFSALYDFIKQNIIHNLLEGHTVNENVVEGYTVKKTYWKDIQQKKL